MFCSNCAWKNNLQVAVHMDLVMAMFVDLRHSLNCSEQQVLTQDRFCSGLAFLQSASAASLLLIVLSSVLVTVSVLLKFFVFPTPESSI